MYICFVVQFDIKIDSSNSLRLIESDSKNISCTSHGVPKKDLIWNFIHQNGSKDEIFDIIYLNTSATSNTNILEIKNIKKKQEGNYECAIKNLPQINAIVEIIVQS